MCPEITGDSPGAKDGVSEQDFVGLYLASWLYQRECGLGEFSVFPPSCREIGSMLRRRICVSQRATAHFSISIMGRLLLLRVRSNGYGDDPI